MPRRPTRARVDGFTVDPMAVRVAPRLGGSRRKSAPTDAIDKLLAMPVTDTFPVPGIQPIRCGGR